MSEEGSEAASTGLTFISDFPQLDALIIPATGKDLPIGMKGQRPYAANMPLEGWTWPRKMESPKLDISSSLTHSLVQKQPGSPTVMSNVSGWGYKSTPSTRKWLTGLAVGSGSALDQYTPW